MGKRYGGGVYTTDLKSKPPQTRINTGLAEMEENLKV